MSVYNFDMCHHIGTLIPLQEETVSLLLCGRTFEVISNILVRASLSVPFISK